MNCTSKLEKKYLRREWPDDWQNQFIQLKKVWSNKIKTSENIRYHHPIYINTFDNQTLSEYNKNDTTSTEQVSCEFYNKNKHNQEQKILKDRENKIHKEATKSHKKILDEIPSFIQILQQLHEKISNILELSDDDICQHHENKPKQRRKRRPKRKYKLRERYYRTETCSVKSTSPERDYETESLISSDDDDMKLSIVHNMSEMNSNSRFTNREDQSYSIKINYVQSNQSKTQHLFSDTVDDIHQVSSNCLLIPLITNVKRTE